MEVSVSSCFKFLNFPSKRSNCLGCLGCLGCVACFFWFFRFEAGLLVQLYEEKRLIQDFSITWEDFPWDEWNDFPELEFGNFGNFGNEKIPQNSLTSLTSLSPKSAKCGEDEIVGILPEEFPMCPLGTRGNRTSVKIRNIFWTNPLQVICICCETSEEKPEKPDVILLIDLDRSSLKILDIYGDGPKKLDVIVEHVETSQTTESVALPSSGTEEETARSDSGDSGEGERDKIVTVMTFEKQKFPESKTPQSGLLCLWKSDRLCIVTSDWKIHDQILVDDAKDRLDMPLCASILPGDGGISILASYASMIIRWWRVSLQSCFQQACVVLSSPATALSLLRLASGEATELERLERLDFSTQSIESSKMVLPGLSTFSTHVSSASRASLLVSSQRVSQRRNSRGSTSTDPKTLSSDQGCQGLIESSATILTLGRIPF